MVPDVLSRSVRVGWIGRIRGREEKEPGKWYECVGKKIEELIRFEK